MNQAQDNRPTVATITVDERGAARIAGKNIGQDREAIIEALEKLIAWLRSH